MMLGDLLARLTEDTIGIEIVPQPFEAGRIVGEHAVEIPNRELCHSRFLCGFVLHEDNVTYVCTYCQGIITFSFLHGWAQRTIRSATQYLLKQNTVFQL